MQRSAKMIADKSFVDAQNRALSYEFNSHVNPVAAPRRLGPARFDSCSTFVGGCSRQTWESGTTIDASSTLRKGNSTRPAVRPDTELFSTAPYRGLGDGIMHHVNDSNTLQRGGFNGASFCPAGKFQEQPYDTFSCISAPTAAENFQRAGVSTRAAPVYLRGQGGCA